MRLRGSLLEAVQGLLERTYAMRSGLSDVGRFLIGDAGYRRFYGDEIVNAVEAAAPGESNSRMLVREGPDGVRASIYYPDDLVRRLEALPPQSGLCDRNVDAFAVLVEELDHLLVVAERARLSRPVSLFELELHANVSKYLVLERFLVRRFERPAPGRRVWLRYHLFEKATYSDRNDEIRNRYRDAARWAVKLIDALPALAPPRQLNSLRRFHRAGSRGKLELIERIAA